MYWWADDGTNGRELWATDGTDAGTAMVKDIWPGSGSGAFTAFANVDFWTIFNDKMYFTANDGTNGQELWATDGTDAGTAMVKNINPQVLPGDVPAADGSFPVRTCREHEHTEPRP